jgi:hypothetical protein
MPATTPAAGAAIPGYTHGTAAVSRSPVSLAELERMKQSVLLGDDDVRYLRMSRDVLADQTDAILDVWYGFVGSQPHLLASFADSAGRPDAAYLEAVRKRFARWILDTAGAAYDQAWLDYQNEIGLRHHRTKKNRTDGATAAPIVPFRDLFLLIFPVTSTLRPFLAKQGHSADDVQKMYEAWVKSCLLQVTLWSRPYVREGDF